MRSRWRSRQACPEAGGEVREPLEQQYFDRFVKPHLSSQIEYLGEVTHEEKVKLLQDARATVFPIEWDEPFGLVMIEVDGLRHPRDRNAVRGGARGDRGRCQRRHRRHLERDGGGSIGLTRSTRTSSDVRSKNASRSTDGSRLPRCVPEDDPEVGCGVRV